MDHPVTVSRRMTDEEADAWRRSLMEWIAKYHPHLADREKLWEEPLRGCNIHNRVEWVWWPKG